MSDERLRELERTCATPEDLERLARELARAGDRSLLDYVSRNARSFILRARHRRVLRVSNLDIGQRDTLARRLQDAVRLVEKRTLRAFRLLEERHRTIVNRIFTNDRMPREVAIVTGGHLGANAMERLEQYMRERASGRESTHRIMMIEAPENARLAVEWNEASETRNDWAAYRTATGSWRCPRCPFGLTSRRPSAIARHYRGAHSVEPCAEDRCMNIGIMGSRRLLCRTHFHTAERGASPQCPERNDQHGGRCLRPEGHAVAHFAGSAYWYSAGRAPRNGMRICSTCDTPEDAHPRDPCPGFNDTARIRERTGARWIDPPPQRTFRTFREDLHGLLEEARQRLRSDGVGIGAMSQLETVTAPGPTTVSVIRRSQRDYTIVVDVRIGTRTGFTTVTERLTLRSLPGHQRFYGMVLGLVDVIQRRIEESTTRSGAP